MGAKSFMKLKHHNHLYEYNYWILLSEYKKFLNGKEGNEHKIQINNCINNRN